MTVLPARDAYRLWAPDYDKETAVSQLEAETVSELGVPTSGRALLDVGCGTARRMRDTGAASTIGVDLSVDMLRRAPVTAGVVAGDMRALPFSGKSFDVVWCRLAIGHVSDLKRAYAELSRVCRGEGMVVVSDLSPDAVAAGHRRTFRGVDGVTREVEHFVHSLGAHVADAESAGLTLVAHRTGRAGASIKRYYAESGRLQAYENQYGEPIVLALVWQKTAS